MPRKNLNSHWFTIEQRQIVIKTLIKKLKILTNGANKRGNIDILKNIMKNFFLDK